MSVAGNTDIYSAYKLALGRAPTAEETSWWGSQGYNPVNVREAIFNAGADERAQSGYTPDQSRISGPASTDPYAEGGINNSQFNYNYGVLTNNPDFEEYLDPITKGRLFYQGTKGQDASVSGPYAWVPQYNELEQSKKQQEFDFGEERKDWQEQFDDLFNQFEEFKNKPQTGTGVGTGVVTGVQTGVGGTGAGSGAVGSTTGNSGTAVGSGNDRLRDSFKKQALGNTGVF